MTTATKPGQPPRKRDGSAERARKEGDRLILEPVARRSLLEVLEGLEPLAEEFPSIEDVPAEDVDL